MLVLYEEIWWPSTTEPVVYLIVHRNVKRKVIDSILSENLLHPCSLAATAEQKDENDRSWMR